MGGDSAFRRLLLDAVNTTISQPPSASSLVDLLRIATPGLLASPTNSKQRRRTEARVRDASQRKRLFRSLQLRIHPDKHGGDERATKLFQEVTLFYGKCLQAMEKEEGRRRRSSGKTNGETIYANYKVGRCGGKTPSTGGDDDSIHKEATETAYSDYGNFDYEKQQRDRRRENEDPCQGGRQPPSHWAFTTIAAILFPPLGLCALFYSIQVRRAWDEGRHGDAHDHSDKACTYALFSCLCVLPLILLLRKEWRH